MKAFNIAQYEQPEFESIDWQKTKYNVGVFLTAYKTARERVGQPACPRRTMEYSLLNKEYCFVIQNEALNDYEEFRHEFIRLNKLFVLGYSSIMHAHYPEITERRRTVFMLKYVNGLSGTAISERINYQKNIIVDDSKTAIIQFAQALSLIVDKEPLNYHQSVKKNSYDTKQLTLFSY